MTEPHKANKPKPLATVEEDEREAIVQEGSGLPIDVVRRDTETGELIEPEKESVR